MKRTKNTIILFVLLFHFHSVGFGQDNMTIHDGKSSHYFQDTKRKNFIDNEEIDTEKLKKDGFLETREGTRIRRMYNNQYYIEERYDDEYRKHKSKRPD